MAAFFWFLADLRQISLPLMHATAKLSLEARSRMLDAKTKTGSPGFRAILPWRGAWPAAFSGFLSSIAGQTRACERLARARWAVFQCRAFGVWHLARRNPGVASWTMRRGDFPLIRDEPFLCHFSQQVSSGKPASGVGRTTNRSVTGAPPDPPAC